ncbi:MAG: hypothetical protein K6E82_03475 [Eubacterium sp.]|nr:hypothetical protein [Eubacterium sp.]
MKKDENLVKLHMICRRCTKRIINIRQFDVDYSFIKY